MLGKLIKYEFKATSKQMFPVLLILVVMAVINKFVVPMLEMSSYGFLHTLHTIFLIGFIVSFIAVGVVALMVLLGRFYKNVLLDEGYFTMTLPVTVDAIVWSKLIVSFIWSIIVSIVVTGSIVLNVMEGYDIFRTLLEMDWDYWNRVMSQIGSGNMILYVIEALIIEILFFVDACLQVYASLTLGHMFKKAKLIMSAVIFAVISVLLITGVIYVIMWADSMSADIYNIFGFIKDKGYLIIHVCAMLLIALEAIPGALMYFTTTIGLKKNLNLE